MRALYSSMRWRAVGDGTIGWFRVEIEKVHGGIAPDWLRDRGDWQLVLPLKPIWVGFLLDTVLYGAVWSVLLGGPHLVRRFLRLRRGLCPKCAYPMGEADVCTECGGALAGHSLRG